MAAVHDCAPQAASETKIIDWLITNWPSRASQTLRRDLRALGRSRVLSTAVHMLQIGRECDRGCGFVRGVCWGRTAQSRSVTRFCAEGTASEDLPRAEGCTSLIHKHNQHALAR